MPSCLMPGAARGFAKTTGMGGATVPVNDHNEKGHVSNGSEDERTKPVR